MIYSLMRRHPLGSFSEWLAGIEVAVEARKIARADFEPDAMASLDFIGNSDVLESSREPARPRRV